MLKDDWLSRAREQNKAFKSRMNSTFSLSSRAAQPDQKSLVFLSFYACATQTLLSFFRYSVKCSCVETDLKNNLRLKSCFVK